MPVLVNNNVINSTGPSISDSFGTGVGLSVAGPIAGAVFSLVRAGIVVCLGLAGLFSEVGDIDALAIGAKFRAGMEGLAVLGWVPFEDSTWSVLVVGGMPDFCAEPVAVVARWSILSCAGGKGPNSEVVRAIPADSSSAS